MGQLTARQRQILLLLLNRTEGMTAAEIASDIGVSVRTVHREMEEIESGLQGVGVLLHKKSGTGIRLEGSSPEAVTGLRERLLAGMPADYSAEERKVLILCALLEADEPIKLFALGHSLKVTVGTISNDLDELESWLARFELQVIRRRGYGVELEGTETERRRAICRLASEYLDYSDLIGDGEANHLQPVTARLLTMIGKPVLLDVERSLWDMDWGWTERLNENVYTQLLIALSVAVSRIRQRHDLEVTDPVTEDARTPPMTEGARQFADRLQKTLGLSMSEAETAHISRLFDEAREQSEGTELPHVDVETMEIVHRLVEAVSRRTGFPFGEDRTLRDGLVEHVGNAVKRLREGTRIRNPLLSPIRKDYEELFTVARQSVDEITQGLDVPDEEIGFLVMHFGASMERLNQLGHHLKAILVCSSGLSSSRLLGIRLSKEMPQIEVLGNASWYEAARIPEDDYDLIISTIDLPLPGEKYIKLSPLLTAEDKEKLLQYIQNEVAPAGSRPVIKREEQRKTASLERLRSQALLLNEVVSLLDDFHVHQLDNRPRDLEGTLAAALAILSKQGAVSNAAHVKARLLERERMGTQLIPDTALALFHTRSREVAKPSLSLFRLAAPVPLEDGAEARVILMMLAPKKLPKESLEVLSEISAMLLGTELIELMERGGEEEIKSYLAEELQLFFRD
ncbi:BglG family transcription antiterminator [Paenibacillus cisolokensis]|uniref:PRD domain-containing protein n=1 Tax=Paenibacillus campinasensis TaxID=66347 RepID=A0A268EWB4_9BACL|nr:MULTISPECIES: BglG family transcription antiterminator [Paenibacillus]MUG67829.1 PRD domain-containing protein [Paenibacillus campinasensis]PAD77422.1 sugar transporter [Paenibacillus campinasensis]PAK48622.1 sugar transporter [Paenibacillus sp. 7541]